MSQDPFQPPKHQPFGANVGHATPTSASNPLLIPGIILIVLASLWLLYGFVNIVYAVMTGAPPAQPGEPEAVSQGRRIGFMVGVALVPIFSLIVLLGGIAMVRLKGYSTAMVGAFVSMVPICGPCFGLSLPFGIWALVLLFNQEVKARFG